jgi:hypothetical protein
MLQSWGGDNKLNVSLGERIRNEMLVLERGIRNEMLVLGRGIRNEMLHSWGGDNK